MEIALRTLAEVERAVGREVAKLVADMRRVGFDWTEIGRIYGASDAAMRQRFEDPPS